MIDAAAFAAMKPGARLIDVARGGIVEVAALKAALDSGHLAGAALDVFDPEPMPESSPFWDMENVMVTPHSSGVFPGWDLKALEIFAENAKRRLAGQPLENIVDPTRGY
jgi:phosphoglycerate dehydrogenase-like enzyme